MSYRQRKPLNKKSIIALIIAVVVVAAALVVMNRLESWQTIQGPSDENSNATYDIGGVECYKKQNIETYLFMGIDNYSFDQEIEPGDTRSPGQNDTNILLIIDRSADTYTTLSIDRNTIVQVPLGNSEIGDITEGAMQLALAYAMGGGGEESCNKAKDAVSNLFYNQRIDGYIALKMDAIQTINHLLGGVTVTIEDDFSKVDSSLKKGATIKLTDEQAESFVRSRKGVADGENTNRVSRQDAFIEAARQQFIEKMKSDESFVEEALEQLEPYMETNLTGSNLSKIAKSVSSDTKVEPPEMKANTNNDGLNGFAETYYEPNSFDRGVIELFYKPVHPEDLSILEDE